MYKVYYFSCYKYREYEERLNIIKLKNRSVTYCDNFYISDGLVHCESFKDFGKGFKKYSNFGIPLELFISLEKVGEKS